MLHRRCTFILAVRAITRIQTAPVRSPQQRLFLGLLVRVQNAVMAPTLLVPTEVALVLATEG